MHIPQTTSLMVHQMNLQNLYYLNLTEQQESKYKAMQRTFQTPFENSLFIDTEKTLLHIFNFEHTKLKKKN